MRPKRTNFEASYQPLFKFVIALRQGYFYVESEFEIKNVNFLSERCEN